MTKVLRSDSALPGKILRFAARHRELEAQGNKEATGDRDANVIFKKAWRLEMQIMQARAFTLPEVEEQLRIAARHLDHGDSEAATVASPKVKEALLLLQRVGIGSTRAHRLIDEAIVALFSMAKRTGVDAGITLSALSKAEASLSQLRSTPPAGRAERSRATPLA